MLAEAGKSRNTVQISCPRGLCRSLLRRGKAEIRHKFPARVVCAEACCGGEKPKHMTNFLPARPEQKLAEAGKSRNTAQISCPRGLSRSLLRRGKTQAHDKFPAREA